MRNLILIISTFLFVSFIKIEMGCYGEFRVIKMQAIYDNVINDKVLTSSAYLFQIPFDDRIIPFKKVNDGIISLNSKNLIYDTNSQLYVDSVRRDLNLNSISWTLNNSSLENFSYTCTKQIPNTIDPNSIPDNISRTSDYIIDFGSEVNVDRIEFNIVDSVKRFTSPWFKRVPGHINTLTIPYSSYSSLQPVGEMFAILALINTETHIINGKKFKFENRLHIKKKISFNLSTQ
ncbi:MAG: hypothetical protein U0V03_09410 [Bacteroidia bacterium]